MSAPTLLGYDSINPEIVRLAGSSVADEAFPQARAALLSVILAMFTILLLTVLSSYERKGHYLSVSKTKAKLQKQKITNPVANVLAHISVIKSKSIDLVVHMELWQEGHSYDRLGLGSQTTQILGVNVPYLLLPIHPGRNIAIVLEVAARNLRLKQMGFSAAEQLLRRQEGSQDESV